MLAVERIIYEPTPYTSRIDIRHIEPSILPPNERTLATVNKDWSYVLERENERDTPWVDSLKDVAVYADMFISYDPGGYEIARDVDSGGGTVKSHDVCRFTRWTEAGNTGVFMRYAEARTAGHGTGVLRSPVMGGLALELTMNPESVSPLDAHTMFVVGRERNAKDSVVGQERAAAAYDLSEFMDEPLYVGPLYNGHPNRVPQGIRTKQIVDLSRQMFNSLADIEPVSQ